MFFFSFLAASCGSYEEAEVGMLSMSVVEMPNLSALPLSRRSKGGEKASSYGYQ